MIFDEVPTEFRQVEFEWDENKEQSNFRKHGIHFFTAAKVFRDPELMIRLDVEHSTEERRNIIGKVQKVLFVVCAFRDGGRIRIISARLATPSERRFYYEKGNNGRDW